MITVLFVRILFLGHKTPAREAVQRNQEEAASGGRGLRTKTTNP